MKTKVFFALFLILALNIKISAQSTHSDYIVSPEFLGVWCIVDIDLTNDPVNGRGELVYEIQDPPEGAGLMGYTVGDGGYFDWIEYGNISFAGPGSPYAIKNGNTLELHFMKRGLELEMLDDHAIFDCTLPVKKTVVILGSRPATYQQCFYVVRLAVKR